ncbi:MAG TPA: FecR domain-containing protein [Oligoflexia bacterium]|nr:FecR domain-containing protein [Oligoflexia bacterium]
MTRSKKFYFLLSVIATVGFVAQRANAQTEIGRLAVVTGDVKVAKNGASDAGKPAKANDPIFNGDVIKTGNGAMAKLLFTDQSIMDVGANSAFKVTDYDLKQGENRTGSFNLMYGKLRALVTKQVGEDGNVKVRTKDAVMGVRGTEFVVNQPPAIAGGTAPPTQIVVVSGRVEVTPPSGGPPVSIGAGQMATAASPSSGDTTSASSSNVQVSSMTAEQMSSVAEGAVAQDNTFVAAVTIAPASGDNSSGPSNNQQAQMMSLASNSAPPPPSMDSSGPRPVDVPVLNSMSFLPPVNIIVGGLVRLTVSIQ